MERSIHTAVSNAPVAALRGDYTRTQPDHTIEQDWSGYTAAEHALWRKLYDRQMRLVPGYACEEFLHTLDRLDASGGIPRFGEISRKLRRATGWELVAVPGLIPDLAFFEHLAHRRFPVTDWLRRPEEAEYIVEPDVFHDFFGHVPLLFDPVYADYMAAYGEGGLKAARLDSLKHLARLYWYTVEFGLMRTPEGLRVYGAGLLSSAGEILYAAESAEPRRVKFELERLFRTDYRIDRFQDTYFVIDGFEQLIADTAPDFAPVYDRIRRLPPIAPDEATWDDVVVRRPAARPQ
jgi:phenylalanine-4-hydroxylase